MTVLRVGARPSRLAIKQAQEISALLPSVAFKVITIKTKGDIDKTTPLSGPVSPNFFTAEIEKALIERRIDLAVHSAKDLEETLPKGLVIAAITPPISRFECLVSRNNILLEELPPGAVVGASSVRRKEAVDRYRSDLDVKDIRGNIDERLKQLDEGKFDAIIVAHAAMIRLGYENRIAQIIPEEIIEPHPLQGRLVVQVRSDRQDLIKIFKRHIHAN